MLKAVHKPQTTDRKKTATDKGQEYTQRKTDKKRPMTAMKEN